MIDYDIASHNPFAALLEAAVDAMIVIDDRAVIQIVNPAAIRLFGYDEGQLIGKNVKMLMPDNISEHHDGYIRHFLETGERGIIGTGRETLGQKKDLTCFPMYLSVGHVLETQGNRFVGIIRDLTSQHRKDEEVARVDLELRQLRERLHHDSRISTLGEMVTGIAHEVNQPLTAIATYAQGCSRMIKAGLDDPKRLLGPLGKIANQAERSGQVIARIRDFSKKSSTVHQLCDCNDTIVQVVALAEVYAAELDVSIDLQLAQAPKLLVMADAIQIQQVLMNLIHNAMEAMEAITGDKIVTILSRQQNSETVEVSVSDVGIGLNEEVEEKILNAFFTTKTSGLGIGLSICESIVSAHGGTLGFRHNKGGGCTAYFTLPTAIEA